MKYFNPKGNEGHIHRVWQCWRPFLFFNKMKVITYEQGWKNQWWGDAHCPFYYSQYFSQCKMWVLLCKIVQLVMELSLKQGNKPSIQPMQINYKFSFKINTMRKTIKNNIRTLQFWCF
jgi:hypothetical protein